MRAETLPAPLLVFQSEYPNGEISIVRVYVVAGRKVVRVEKRSTR